jgi:hypothetical protein
LFGNVRNIKVYVEGMRMKWFSPETVKLAFAFLGAFGSTASATEYVKANRMYSVRSGGWYISANEAANAAAAGLCKFSSYSGCRSKRLRERE